MLQLTPNILLDTICMVAVYILAIYNYICMKDKRKGTGYFFFVVFITLFSLLYRPKGGDFWGYLADYELGVDYSYRHMEPFYYWLMGLVPSNYLLWRVTIWLPAAIIIAVTFKIQKIPASIAVTLFLLLAILPSYYYTRNALALSLLYLAITILCQYGKKLSNKTINIIIFLGLVLASWYLHRSMPLYILIAILAVLLPYNKNYMIGALLVFPLLYGAVVLFASDYLSIAQLWIDESTGFNYLEESNSVTANWKGIISLIIGYAPIAYFYIIAFKKPIPKELPEFYTFKVFLLFSFITVFISFLFWGQGSASIQGRIYKSSMLPFTFAVCLYFNHYLKTKRFNTFFILLGVSIAWGLLIGALSSE